MNWETILGIALGSGVIGAIVKAISDKKLKRVDDTLTITKMYREIIEEKDKELEETEKENEAKSKSIADLQIEIALLWDELKTHKIAIETLTSDNLRHRLIISILVAQINSIGHQPIISTQEIDTIPQQELRDIAASMQRNEQRRQAKKGNIQDDRESG